MQPKVIASYVSAIPICQSGTTDERTHGQRFLPYHMGILSKAGPQVTGTRKGQTSSQVQETSGLQAACSRLPHLQRGVSFRVFGMELVMKRQEKRRDIFSAKKRHLVM